MTFTSFKKKETNQGLVPKITDIADYLLIFSLLLVLSAKLVGAGCYWKSPKLLVSNSLCGTDIYNYVTQ